MTAVTEKNQDGQQPSIQTDSQPQLASDLAEASATANLPEIVEIYLRQAQAFCKAKQWDKAIEACKEALQADPAAAEAYKLWGNIMQKQGMPIDAMGFYAKALSIRPDYAEAYHNLGTIEAGQQNWEQAILYYQKAIEKDADFAAAYLNLSKVWKALDEDDKEVDCLVTAFRLQPDFGVAKDHYKIGQKLEARENEEAAIAFYRQAVEKDPNFVLAYQRLADLLENQDDWQEAAVCYRKVIELNEVSAQASQQTNSQTNAQTNVQAGALATRSNQTEAIAPSNQSAQQPAAPLTLSKGDQAKLQKLLQISSTRTLIGPNASQQPTASKPAPAALPAAVSAQQSDRDKKQRSVIQALEQAIQKDPQSAALYRNLAKVLDQSNQKQRAAVAWYRSFMLEPSWPSMEQCLELGDVMLAQNNTEAAINCYQQAIRLRPDFRLSYDKLSQLLRSQGNTQAAEAVAQQYVATYQENGKKKALAAPLPARTAQR